MNRIIAEAKDNGGDAIFRVRWTRFGADDDTWEPEAYLPAGVVTPFRARQAKKRR